MICNVARSASSSSSCSTSSPGKTVLEFGAAPPQRAKRREGGAELSARGLFDDVVAAPLGGRDALIGSVGTPVNCEDGPNTPGEGGHRCTFLPANGADAKGELSCEE
jgi:hypothetical protein